MNKVIQFKTSKGRLHYIKKKAREQREDRVKYCCVCGATSMYYAYIANGPKYGACCKHKEKLQPVLAAVFAKMRDYELLGEYKLESVEELREENA